MTATQAPTPGPLSGDDIGYVRDYWSAICDSDWHLIPADIRDDLDERLVAVGLAEWRAVTDDDLEDTFAYERGIEKGRSCLDLTALGHLAFKSDADGWMPWSGGENPVDYRQNVEVRYRDGRIVQCAAGTQDWTRLSENGEDATDIIAFRLAPTAPVEASGSEREHGPKCWGGTSFSDEMAHCYCGSTDLRPQPSGETREAVRLALEDADALDRVSEEADDNQWQDWAATMRQAASRIRRLALLSTSPLALGGQQGDSETLRVLLDNLVIAQTLSKDIRQKATDEARSYLYGRRHTTARAEALDEGAAGDIEFPYQRTFNAIADAVSFTWAGDSGKPHTFNISVEAFQRSYNNGRQATHPSPPPAADEDRVRSALADLVTWFDKPVQGERGMIWVIRAGDQGADDAVAEALAALKSEGK